MSTKGASKKKSRASMSEAPADLVKRKMQDQPDDERTEEGENFASPQQKKNKKENLASSLKEVAQNQPKKAKTVRNLSRPLADPLVADLTRGRLRRRLPGGCLAVGISRRSDP